MLANSFLATFAGAALFALGTFRALIQGAPIRVSVGLAGAAKPQEWV